MLKRTNELYTSRVVSRVDWKQQTQRAARNFQIRQQELIIVNLQTRQNIYMPGLYGSCLFLSTCSWWFKALSMRLLSQCVCDDECYRNFFIDNGHCWQWFELCDDAIDDANTISLQLVFKIKEDTFEVEANLPPARAIKTIMRRIRILINWNCPILVRGYDFHVSRSCAHYSIVHTKNESHIHSTTV